MTRGYTLKRRAEQLLNEVGYTKGPDGVFTSPTDGRLSLEARASANAQYEQDLLVITNGWQRLGIDATSNLWPIARLQDGQFRASFGGGSSDRLSTGSSGAVNICSFGPNTAR